MKSARLFVLQVLLGVVIVGFFGCSDITEKVGKGITGSKTRDVKITPVKLWTDTGLDVKAGQEVEIRAQGEVFINENTACSPTGLQDPGAAPIKKMFLRKFNVMREAGHGALIGKVGDGGTPFLVGKAHTFKSHSEGRLYLGINDKDYHNNHGAFEAEVTLK